MKSLGIQVILAVSLVAGLAGGCSTARINAAGESVQVVDAGRVARCRNLGPVSGTGGGSFGGAWISNSDLVEYAMNDLRNEAGERRATHVVVASNSMAANHTGSTTTAVVTGNAYQCTAADLSEPAASVPAPTATPASAAGTELGPCYGNGTCNDGLLCASGLCVRLPVASTSPAPAAE